MNAAVIFTPHAMEQMPGRAVLSLLAEKAETCVAWAGMLVRGAWVGEPTFAEVVSAQEEAEESAMQQAMFAYAVSVLAHHLMCADGEVNTKESKAFEAFFSLSGMANSRLQEFLIAAEKDRAPVKQYARQLREACEGDVDALREIMTRLARLALADAPLSEQECDVLFMVGGVLGMPRAEVARLVDEADGLCSGSPESLLKLRGGEDAEAVQRAYRERMRYCHPDRWSRKPEHKEIYRLATLKSAAVNEAYRTLTQGTTGTHRGMKNKKATVS